MTDDLPPDDTEEFDSAANAQGVRRKRTKIERAQEQDRQFWRGILSTETGRRVIWDLVARDAGIFDNRFAVGPNGFPSPDQTWFNLGKKDIGERLYRTLMVADRDAVLKMHDEHDAAFAKPKRQTRPVDGD